MADHDSFGASRGACGIEHIGYFWRKVYRLKFCFYRLHCGLWCSRFHGNGDSTGLVKSEIGD